MKKATIAMLILGVLSLISCSRINNEFVVVDQNDVVTLAEVRLCGKHQQLSKFDAEFRGSMPITCEGEGIILLRLADGSETRCHIGYFTPGLEQTFQFTLEGGHCR